MPDPVPEPVGTLAELIRYPIKSMQGERLSRARVDARGLEYDRLWSVYDAAGRLGSGKSSRRFVKMQGLLHLTGSVAGDDSAPTISWPDGRSLRVDSPAAAQELSGTLRLPVTVARETAVPHHDDGPVHLVTTASLRWLEGEHGTAAPVARFRPNMVLDTGDLLGPVEQGWVGRELVVGQIRLRITAPMPRCVMTTMDQLHLPADREMLHTLSAHADLDFGVVADVLAPGELHVGDAASLVPGALRDGS